MDTTLERPATGTGATQVAMIYVPVANPGGVNDYLVQLHERGAQVAHVRYHIGTKNHDPVVFIVYREAAS